MDYRHFKTQYHLRLDPQQEQAVQTVEGPVLLLAVPGSGKTTVLVSRVGYMRYVQNIPPGQILTMTYTVAAARDMRERYDAFFGEGSGAELEFRTINGVCARIIRRAEQLMGQRAFSLLEDGKEQAMLIGELCRNLSGEFSTESTIKAVQTAITYAKNMMLTEGELQKVEVEGVDFPAVFHAYEQTLRSRRLMDYDDQMVYALRLLQKQPRILEELQQRYRYFCVDEAQDTSKIQHVIIRLLASKSGNLFMVGDEDQSIYGFRAAYPQALTEFEQVYPEAGVLYMEQNYRSLAPIVKMADQFIQANENRHPKHMKAIRGEGTEVKERVVFDRRQQYRYLCKVARGCGRETAVLYRDNDSALPLIDLMDREGIPYRCRQVDSLFFTHRTVRDMMDIIRFAQDPYDGERFMNFYYKLGAGISKKIAQAAVRGSMQTGVPILEYICGLSGVKEFTKKQCRTLGTHMKRMLEESGDKAVSRIVHHMGYGAYLQERGSDLNKTVILEALGEETDSPQQLLDRLDELKEVVQRGSTGDRSCPFVLSTIHSSKGLEYDRVFLMDVVDGMLPGSIPGVKASKEEKEAYEEERRLFYVGMTRAKNELNVFTFTKFDLPSKFTRELFPKPEDKRKKTSGPRPAPKPGMSHEQARNLAKDYLPGTRVVHRTFGPGVLVSLVGDIANFSFDSGTDKRISLSTAIRSNQLKME